MSPLDCTIIIPVPRADPDIDTSSRITLHLHSRHLSSKSAFLRGLLSGISPLDLVRDLSAARLLPSIPLSIPPSRLPRLLPSPPTHPVLLLPVPDPCSIQLLFHWMHAGETDYLERALDQGLVQWEGLARNVEYLCLSTDIKVFLGRWYRSRCLPAQPAPGPADEDGDGDDTSDGDSANDDSDGREWSSGPSTDESDEECDRGRARDIKPLVQLCGQLRLCAA